MKLKAAYRQVNVDCETLQVIATPHWQLTRANAAPQPLVPRDKTGPAFGRSRVAKGLGPTGKNHGREFLPHHALIVDANTHATVDDADQTVHDRSETRKKKERTQQFEIIRETKGL